MNRKARVATLGATVAGASFASMKMIERASKKQQARDQWVFDIMDGRHAKQFKKQRKKARK